MKGRRKRRKRYRLGFVCEGGGVETENKRLYVILSEAKNL